MSYATVEQYAAHLGTAYAAIYRSDASAAADDLLLAAAEIDGYLAKRYATPVSAEGALGLLRDFSFALASEKAYARAGGSDLPEKVKRRADTVRKSLRDIASGAMTLPAVAAENPRGAGSTAAVEMDEPVFTREKMGGY